MLFEYQEQEQNISAFGMLVIDGYSVFFFKNQVSRPFFSAPRHTVVMRGLQGQMAKGYFRSAH